MLAFDAERLRPFLGPDGVRGRCRVHGLTLTSLQEHREAEWQALPWLVRGEQGRYALPEHPERLPLTYSLTAVRPS